jgi:hypothetical protein
MNKHQAFAAWAPTDSIWSVWAKPVLFAHMSSRPLEVPPPSSPLTTPPFQAPPASDRTAIVLDLPGSDAILFAVVLAAVGYRPVPLYNSVRASPGSPAALDMTPVLSALQHAAPQLASLFIPPDAPPVFLLDATRAVGSAPLLPGTFDNRSISLPTDFPSATFLVAHGIRRVLLVQLTRTTPLEDLSHTLLRYQQAGLEIHAQSLADGEPPHPIKVARPSLFRTALHRFIAMTGFRRHPLGGFGGTLPEPSSG